MRRRPAVVFVLATLAFLLGIAGAACAQAKADLRWIDDQGALKEDLDAEVTSFTWESIVFRPKGKTAQTLPADRVRFIEYKNRPEAFDRAREAVRDGQWAAAAGLLETLTKDPALAKSAPWIVEETGWLAFVVAIRRGRLEDQAAADLVIRTVSPRSRRFWEMRVIDVLHQAARDDFKSAEALIGEVTQDQTKLGVTRTFLKKLMVYRAMLAWRKGEIAANEPALPEEPYASLVQGYRALAKKDFREARANFKKAAEDKTPADAFVAAHAWNGQAIVSEALGEFDQAMLETTRTPALSLDDPLLYHEVGEALWRWATLAKKAAERITDAADPKKKALLRRFRDLRQRAADEFPLSRGGRAAQKDQGS